MTKRRKNKPGPKQNGWVYVISIVVADIQYYKIGTTNRTVRHRLGEMALELHDNLGYIPVMKIVMERQTLNNYAVESELLKVTLPHKPQTGQDLFDKFSGWSELRCMKLKDLELRYGECLAKDYATVQPTLIEM